MPKFLWLTSMLRTEMSYQYCTLHLSMNVDVIKKSSFPLVLWWLKACKHCARNAQSWPDLRNTKHGSNGGVQIQKDVRLTMTMSRLGTRWSGSMRIRTSSSLIPLNRSRFFFRLASSWDSHCCWDKCSWDDWELWLLLWLKPANQTTQQWPAEWQNATDLLLMYTGSTDKLIITEIITPA